ncbi:hypothetical protein [Phaeocystidibacter luteus]|uniref:Uncharacterized protein n=1 Tax=Phaeocystidibacter luteus TaxID=911197 RepID=A0A6N6REV8_9FLAO|nr:hypothetical protein [Phaeocystidibacter luteus]KAB2807358.1 hypothetical protein F8C67_12335 [Phaeocystidibacter luteus]
MRKILTLAAVSVALVSCDRDTDPQGPSLDELYGDFSVLQDFEVTRNTVNFASGQNLHFTARFSKTVDWEIHIVGETSGAEKIFTGKSKVVDAENALWNGTTTNLPMFKREACMAYITVPEEGYGDTIPQINVDSVRVTTGFVIADFESGMNPGWNSFAQSGADMSWNIVQADSAAEKEHYFDMGGEVNFDYLIGLIDFPASAYNEALFPLNPNPDQVYFNVFLYKPAGITNEIVLFQFREDENENGIYNQNNEDMYSLELKGLDVGWQMISIRYSDMVALVNGQPADPAGNGVHEPDKLLQVSVLFLADPSSGYSQTWMDNLIFTENQAFQP